MTYEKAGGLPIGAYFVSFERPEGSAIYQKTDKGYVMLCSVLERKAKIQEMISDNSMVMPLIIPGWLFKLLEEVRIG